MSKKVNPLTITMKQYMRGKHRTEYSIRFYQTDWQRGIFDQTGYSIGMVINKDEIPLELPDVELTEWYRQKIADHFRDNVRFSVEEYGLKNFLYCARQRRSKKKIKIRKNELETREYHLS